jgi:hypothetical protein
MNLVLAVFYNNYSAAINDQANKLINQRRQAALEAFAAADPEDKGFIHLTDVKTMLGNMNDDYDLDAGNIAVVLYKID